VYNFQEEILFLGGGECCGIGLPPNHNYELLTIMSRLTFIFFYFSYTIIFVHYIRTLTGWGELATAIDKRMLTRSSPSIPKM
jgi:hypothetical protein